MVQLTLEHRILIPPDIINVGKVARRRVNSCYWHRAGDGEGLHVFQLRDGKR
jgi:hypothetical protein